MYELIAGFPQQLAKAVELGKNLMVPPPPPDKIRNIVVAGMGGSGIGANIVQNLIIDELTLPYQITKTYTVPASVGKHTLFIACSFSGGTEETLSALQQAEERGATVFAITSGGKLLEIAQAKGYGYAILPNEAPCPRAFLGYSMVQLLFTLHRFGFISHSFEKELQVSITELMRTQEAIQVAAKVLASHCKGRQVIAYADGQLEPILVRLQQQINENAKQLCHLNIIPEMNHNELVGWGLPPENYQNIALLWVRHTAEHPRISKRIEICQTRLNPKAGATIEVHPKGDSPIAQALYLIHLFDWASYYLAEENQVDAFEIEPIIYLKNELAKF